MSSALQLGVNIDHIATIRQARGTRYPDPVQAAFAAVDAGADLITVHLREDRRHIQERDVRLLHETLTVPLNLEMAATPAMIAFARTIRPQKCCLVPERREELTTEGGLDVATSMEAIRGASEVLAEAGIEVSLFIDANERQLEAAAECAVPVIELHTGSYAEASEPAAREQELEKLIRGAAQAVALGLVPNAGHGLTYENVAPIAAIAALRELNIGHAIVARALFSGFGAAVHDMKRTMLEARR